MSHAVGDLVAMCGDLECDDDSLPVADGSVGIVDAIPTGEFIAVDFPGLGLVIDLPADAVMAA